MPDWIKPLGGLGVFIAGGFHMLFGAWPRKPDYARAGFGVGLMVLGLMLSACSTGPTSMSSVKYRGCVNHDLTDHHGSNAQQDC